MSARKEKDSDQSEDTWGQDDVFFPRSWSHSSMWGESLTGFGGLAILGLIISMVISVILGLLDIGVLGGEAEIACFGNLAVVCTLWLVFVVIGLVVSLFWPNNKNK